MTHGSIDFLRQSGWDLWVLVCVVASLALLVCALLARGATDRRTRLAFILSMTGVLGTSVILAIPALHSPRVGLVWTFLLLTLVSITFYLNLHRQLNWLRTGVLLMLRIAALAVLVPMLFEPVMRYVSVPVPTRPLLILVDASGSMSVPDAPNGPTRLQSVWQALRPQFEEIDRHFVASYFAFDNHLRTLERPQDLASLQADGQSTDIVNGVTSLLAQSKRDDAEIILVSDGIDNASPNVAEALRSTARTVHTVSVGSDQSEPAAVMNVAVDDVQAADDFVVNYETRVKATIRSTALADRIVDVKLSEIDSAGKAVGELHSERLVLQPAPQGQIVELPYKPPAVGVRTLAVWIDPVAGERSTIDNRQQFQGLAIDPRIKVIYIEGRARPEYRELARALARDPSIELATLLRVQEERFAASGTVDGQPFKQMPTTETAWAVFDVIILGDLGRSFLPPVQQQLIEQRTSAGGALLMIGGQNSFGPGGYEGTAIERALPVFVGELSAGQEKSEFVPRLTPDGAAHPMMDGLSDWFGTDEKPAAKTLPPLRGNVIVAKAKSGAQVLLVHRDRPAPNNPAGQIVLACQLYGQGRSAAFTVDTTYLWYLPLRGMGQDSPYNRLWGQLVRWLAAHDVRDRQHSAGLVALLNKNVHVLGESVKVRAMVRDERGDATRYAQVSVAINTPGEKPGEKNAKRFTLAPSESHAGLYELVIPGLGKGDYEAELVATKDGKELGREKLKFTIIPPADEMLKLAANPVLLSAVAEQTHGFHYELGQFPALLDQLIRADPRANDPQQRSVALSNYIRAAATAMRGADPGWATRYDLPMQGLLAIALLTIEWLLRRRWQLP